MRKSGQECIDLLLREKALRGTIAAESRLNLQRRMGLEIAIPVGVLPIACKHHALLLPPVIEHHRDDSPPNETCLASTMGQQQEFVIEQPPQVQSIEVAWQSIDPFAQSGGLRGKKCAVAAILHVKAAFLVEAGQRPCIFLYDEL